MTAWTVKGTNVSVTVMPEHGNAKRRTIAGRLTNVTAKKTVGAAATNDRKTDMLEITYIVTFHERLRATHGVDWATSACRYASALVLVFELECQHYKSTVQWSVSIPSLDRLFEPGGAYIAGFDDETASVDDVAVHAHFQAIGDRLAVGQEACLAFL